MPTLGRRAVKTGGGTASHCGRADEDGIGGEGAQTEGARYGSGQEKQSTQTVLQSQLEMNR